MVRKEEQFARYRDFVQIDNGKDIGNISKHDDDCNAEEVNDPHYELFLEHLKEHDKSYALEYERDGLPMVIKYEEDIDLDKEGDPDPEPRRKISRAQNEVNEKILERQDQRMLTRLVKHKLGPSKKIHDVGSERKHDPESTLVKKTNNANMVENLDGLPTDMVPDPKNIFLYRNVELGGDHNVSTRKGRLVVNKSINHQEREDGRKLSRATKPRSGFLNQMPLEDNQQCTSVKKTKSRSCGSSGNETDKGENHHRQSDRLEDDPHVYMHKGHTMVYENTFGVNDQKKQSGRNLDRSTKQKVVLPNQMPCLENHWDLDRKPASAHKTKSLTPKESRNEAHNVLIEKCSANEFRKVKAAKCFMAYSDIEQSNLEKEGKGKSVSDVEILDEATYLKKGSLSPFVSSKKFAKSIEEDGIQHIGSDSDVEMLDEAAYLKKGIMEEDGIQHIGSDSDVEILDKAVHLKKGIMEEDGIQHIGSDSDVEILDEAAYLKKGTMEGGAIQHTGSSSACDVFRKGVLNVSKKPDDREEYRGT